MLRSLPSRKPRHRKIKTTPEKMDRAAFSAESRPEFLKDAVRLDQNTPKSVRIFGVISPMLLVLLEWNRIHDFVRRGVDFYRQIQLVQRAHRRLVKIRDGARLELDRFFHAIALQNSQPMIDKIKTDFERVAAVRNRRSRKTARSDIKRDVPRMIGPGREGEPDLAHDLHPHMQGGASVFPIRVI